MAELEEHVIPLVATKWYGLGLVLLDTRYKDLLDIMEKQHMQDIQLYCKRMFSKWLETSDITTWYQLIEATRCINQNNVADKIESYLLQGDFIVGLCVCVCVCLCVCVCVFVCVCLCVCLCGV